MTKTVREKSPIPPDLSDVNGVLTYGADAQSRVAEFSEIALENLKGRDMGEVSDKLAELVVRLKNPPKEEKTPTFQSFFRKSATTAEVLKGRCKRAGDAVDRIAASLQGYRNLLMQDIEMLEMLYSMNREQYETLTAYVDNGRDALERFQEETLAPLRKQAEETGSPCDAQAVRDALEQADRFEKKLHDLELTRAVSLQMAPQIRMLQNNNTIMAEKIQSSLVNTIPLWKSQMMLTLGMEHSRSAISVQKQMTDITNALLERNANTLKQTTLAVTAEAERGCIDVKTLKQTTEILISTMDEVLTLRAEGQKARREAEAELRRIDGEIRLRLLNGKRGDTRPPLPSAEERNKPSF